MGGLFKSHGVRDNYLQCLAEHIQTYKTVANKMKYILLISCSKCLNDDAAIQTQITPNFISVNIAKKIKISY